MCGIVKSTVMVFAVLASRLAGAEGAAHSDEEIKHYYVHAGMCGHYGPARSHLRHALALAEYDTNRFARVLRELAVENTNQTERVVQSLRQYKTPQSLPFLYAYATNATYGADALKAIFAIEGVTSNSVLATRSYLSITNAIAQRIDYDRSDVCEWLLKEVATTPALAHLKPMCLTAAVNYAKDVSLMHRSLDEAICAADGTYRCSKRRLAAMRSAQDRCWNEMLTNYVTNAINELVAYPESDLPD